MSRFAQFPGCYLRGDLFNVSICSLWGVAAGFALDDIGHSLVGVCHLEKASTGIGILGFGSTAPAFLRPVTVTPGFITVPPSVLLIGPHLIMINCGPADRPNVL
jgi:hypothetical protein